MFDFSDYHLRELDINQGYKPLDFGYRGLTGSVNKDGRIIAVNNYHPEHGYITLTSIPPFPDADRYDATKVRAYRKSLVTNEGFGVQFEQDIIKREYYLIEDAIPFMRFTLADGTIAECVTVGDSYDMMQVWKFSSEDVAAKLTGKIWLQRAAYTQLTEGGVVPMPPVKTKLSARQKFTDRIQLTNDWIDAGATITAQTLDEEDNGLRFGENPIELTDSTFIFSINIGDAHAGHGNQEEWIYEVLPRFKELNLPKPNLVLSRARVYGYLCTVPTSEWEAACILTDHLILPLSWNRDAYYVAAMFLQDKQTRYQFNYMHQKWIYDFAWLGAYSKATRKPIGKAWGRSYMANGMPKDNRKYQLDQQIFPLLEACEYYQANEDNEQADSSYLRRYIVDALKAIISVMLDFQHNIYLFSTDETPADDDIPMHFHFSSHVLLWHTIRKIEATFANDKDIIENSRWLFDIDHLRQSIDKYFITEHKGKKLYSYATDGEGNHYLYHDANDIPLVMMPLWGFCDKDDPVWRNTIDFAWSADNKGGCYDGKLGSIHTPAPWPLGDAQELIYCKVIGDRERYQRTWERIEKAAQWDGALPEAYNPDDYRVVSRHWFAWPNAMVAIADNISWDWEVEQS